MNRSLFILVSIFMAYLGPFSAQAEEGTNSPSWGSLYQVPDSVDIAEPSEMPSAIQLSENNEVLRRVWTAAQQSQEAKYQHETWRLGYIQDAFDQHLRGTLAVFIVVVIIVMSGLVMSWMQFSAYTRAASAHSVVDKQNLELAPSSIPNAPAVAPGPVNETAPVTSFKFNRSGVEFSSPILGLAILVFSLAFFFLYIVHVYPLHDINGNTQKLPTKPGVSAPKK